jgi:hypothetical protein
MAEKRFAKVDSKRDSKAGKLLRNQALSRSWHSTTELLPQSPLASNGCIQYTTRFLAGLMPLPGHSASLETSQEIPFHNRSCQTSLGNTQGVDPVHGDWARIALDSGRRGGLIHAECDGIENRHNNHSQHRGKSESKHNCCSHRHEKWVLEERNHPEHRGYRY